MRQWLFEDLRLDFNLLSEINLNDLHTCLTADFYGGTCVRILHQTPRL